MKHRQAGMVQGTHSMHTLWSPERQENGVIGLLFERSRRGVC